MGGGALRVCKRGLRIGIWIPGPGLRSPDPECPIHALVTSETERQADGGAPEIEIAQRQVEVVVRFVVLQ